MTTTNPRTHDYAQHASMYRSVHNRDVDLAKVFRTSAAHFTSLASEYAANGRHEDAYFAKLNAGYAKQLADACDHPIQRVKRSRDRGPSLF